jgi:hypothetical protein
MVSHTMELCVAIVGNIGVPALIVARTPREVAAKGYRLALVYWLALVGASLLVSWTTGRSRWGMDGLAEGEPILIISALVASRVVPALGLGCAVARLRAVRPHAAVVVALLGAIWIDGIGILREVEFWLRFWLECWTGVDAWPGTCRNDVRELVEGVLSAYMAPAVIAGATLAVASTYAKDREARVAAG